MCVTPRCVAQRRVLAPFSKRCDSFLARLAMTRCALESEELPLLALCALLRAGEAAGDAIMKRQAIRDQTRAVIHNSYSTQPAPWSSSCVQTISTVHSAYRPTAILEFSPNPNPNLARNPAKPKIDMGEEFADVRAHPPFASCAIPVLEDRSLQGQRTGRD
ncbi:hypothetical protein PSPO01_11840 [Paraphaeosphaeria sporulosa]